MSDPTEEAQAVAAATVRQRFGDNAAVDLSDIRRAEQFIAAADALIAFRMAQSAPKGLGVVPMNCIGDRIDWPSDGTSEPALARQDEGGA